MKRNIALLTSVALLLALSGCKEVQNNQRTVFCMDTVCTITADTDSTMLDGAVSLIGNYEKLFSATDKNSEIYKINAGGEVAISDDTATIIRQALYYCNKTSGKFDISILPLSELWDFEKRKIPDENKLAEALNSVGYGSIRIIGNTVDTGGKRLDLGALAKGYVADRLKEYFKQNGVSNVTASLGGNLLLMGNDYVNVGIKNPFGDGNIAQLKLKNTSVVTSGIYERAFTENGVTYHHILDPKTGKPVETDVVSATVICEKSVDADALSTCCVLLGRLYGMKLIEEFDGAEVILITQDGSVYISSGIYSEDGYYRL